MVVLEKTPESPLDSKIKPVNLKGDQPWIFTGRTDAVAEAPIFWSSYVNRTHWKSPSCWERLRVGTEEGVRGLDGWMASLKQWMWTWANSGRWWGTGRPDVLQSMGSQRVGPDWTTFTFNVLQCCVGFCLTTMWISHNYIYCCCCSVAQYCVTLCNFMDCSIPGLPVPHHLLVFAQVHVHCISWCCLAISFSDALFSFALYLSQHQGIFQWVICSHQMTKLLELQLQHQSFQWIFRVDLP